MSVTWHVDELPINLCLIKRCQDIERHVNYGTLFSSHGKSVDIISEIFYYSISTNVDYETLQMTFLYFSRTCFVFSLAKQHTTFRLSEKM